MMSLETENTYAMESTVASLLSFGKGILAADESFRTLEKRFEEFHIPSTEENRRAYRETLFSTPGLGEYISGVILFDETIRQRTGENCPFPEALQKQGIIPGIKGLLILKKNPVKKSPRDWRVFGSGSSNIATSAHASRNGVPSYRLENLSPVKNA